MNVSKVSVIIPAYNCENTIEKVINAILSQDFEGLEVIVVDDGSTDATSSQIKSFELVKYLYQENAGPATARNLGAKKAQGEYLFFTDSDCIPEYNWISNGMRYFSQPEIAVVAGTYGIENKNSILARCIHQEIIYRHDKLMPTFPSAFGSYNFAIRKNIFDNLGGFDEGYPFASGEDNDLSYKIINSRHRILFARDVVVRHYHPENFLKYMKEQYRHGFWRVKLYAKYPKMAKGDGYTFWKDIFEIHVSFLIAIFLIALPFVHFHLFVIVVALSFVLLTVEFLFSIMILKNIYEIVFMIFIMYFRSFFRMLGFFSGFMRFILNFQTK